MGEVDGRLAKISELERKVRIIANLPGSAASGGDEVTAIEPEVEPGGQGGARRAVLERRAGAPPLAPAGDPRRRGRAASA